MKTVFAQLLGSLLVITTANSAWASPVHDMVFSPAQVSQRILNSTNQQYLDLIEKMPDHEDTKLRAMQVNDKTDSESNWKGLRSWLLMSKVIDPGGLTDGSNMFVYTCRRGWVDMGHVVGSALALISARMMLFTNSSILKERGAKYLTPEEMKLLDEVSNFKMSEKTPWNDEGVKWLVWQSLQLEKFRNDMLGVPVVETRTVDDIIKMMSDQQQTYSYKKRSVLLAYFASFFALRTGYNIEVLQNSGKAKQERGKFDGWTESAWTLEDLPSDYIGIQMGFSVPLRLNPEDNKFAFEKFMREFFEKNGAVDPANVTNVPNCHNKEGNITNNAGEIISADAKSYADLTAQDYVKFEAGQSTDPQSPYNFTIKGKHTIQHDCVCDPDNNPIKN